MAPSLSNSPLWHCLSSTIQFFFFWCIAMHACCRLYCIPPYSHVEAPTSHVTCIWRCGLLGGDDERWMRTRRVSAGFQLYFGKTESRAKPGAQELLHFPKYFLGEGAFKWWSRDVMKSASPDPEQAGTQFFVPITHHQSGPEAQQPAFSTLQLLTIIAGQALHSFLSPASFLLCSPPGNRCSMKGVTEFFLCVSFYFILWGSEKLSSLFAELDHEGCILL